MINKTEKIYYSDAYTKEFVANVISSEACDNGFDTILDKTAFFPEEGGQSSDTGYIGTARVLSVFERDGIIHHITDTISEPGEQKCSLNFDERYEKMQLHTAEHILCGIFHSKFGYDNVGFHLGDIEVTFDINAVLTREILDEVENEANRAVFSNMAVVTEFPTATQLSDMVYRSKLDITENVRIVKIGDVDSCACCAPHVARTGEIGIIKMLHFEKHRGGTRIWMTAGSRALADYRDKYSNVLKISSMLSVPCSDTADALHRYMQETEKLKYLLKESGRKYAELFAEAVTLTDKNAVYYLPDLEMDDLRTFSNKASEKVGGILVALCGEEGNLKYVITSHSVDLLSIIKEINVALGGKGGGRANMAQGTFAATVAEVERFFEVK